MNRMAWIDRPTIGADRVVEAAMLNEQRLHAQLSAGAAVPKVSSFEPFRPRTRAQQQVMRLLCGCAST